jgi:hypothetical protein
VVVGLTGVAVIIIRGLFYTNKLGWYHGKVTSVPCFGMEVLFIIWLNRIGLLL